MRSCWPAGRPTVALYDRSPEAPAALTAELPSVEVTVHDRARQR